MSLMFIELLFWKGSKDAEALRDDYHWRVRPRHHPVPALHRHAQQLYAHLVVPLTGPRELHLEPIPLTDCYSQRRVLVFRLTEALQQSASI